MPSPTILLAILLAISVAGNALLGKLYVRAESKYAAEQQAYKTFADGVKLRGDEQEARTKIATIANQKAKEDADAKHVKVVADLNARYAAALASLRDRTKPNPGSGVVPAFASVTGASDKTCYDSAAVDRAVSDFRQGILGILNQGDQAIADLTAAQLWGQTVRQRTD